MQKKGENNLWTLIVAFGLAKPGTLKHSGETESAEEKNKKRGTTTSCLRGERGKKKTEEEVSGKTIQKRSPGTRVGQKGENKLGSLSRGKKNALSRKREEVLTEKGWTDFWNKRKRGAADYSKLYKV